MSDGGSDASFSDAAAAVTLISGKWGPGTEICFQKRLCADVAALSGVHAGPEQNRVAVMHHRCAVSLPTVSQNCFTTTQYATVSAPD